MARTGDGRIARRLLGAVRADHGQAGKGNRGESLLGGFGRQGTLLGHLMRHLTAEARRKYFSGRRGDWFELAQEREQWRRFVKGVKIEF